MREFRLFATSVSNTGEKTVLLTWIIFNDVFLPKEVGIDEEDFHLWIFDRWGNLIGETCHLHWGGETWDGKANGGANIAQINLERFTSQTQLHRACEYCMIR